MLQIQNISQSYENAPVLQGISLEVAAGEIRCLLGPSGCGKTTLLRIIAGLEKADSGSVQIMGQEISGQPVYARDFGLMFQDFALFPHMNVAQNVAFGLQMKHLSRSEIQQRIQEALALVGLEGFEKRAVTGLSGGEQQRVALARSLAPRPRLLMLDEPLGSLDAALRERLVLDVREIIKKAGVTAIYVTHDQQEAFAIADQITVMNAGHLEQTASPETLYIQPQTIFVAEFLGLKNILTHAECRLLGIEAPAADHVLLHPAFAEMQDTDAIPVNVEGRVFRGFYTQLKVRHHSGIVLYVQIPATMQPQDILHIHFSKIIPLV